MTDEKFRELINLYLDREISSREQAWLKRELEANPERKCEFEQRCRLHQAMRLALDPNAGRCRPSRSDRGDTRRNLRSAHVAPAPAGRRWFLGSGIAASLLLGVVGIASMKTDSNMFLAQTDEGPGDRISPESFEFINADMQRFEAIRREAASGKRIQGSLAGHLRLLGLSPEMGPRQNELEGIDIVVLAEEIRSGTRGAELLNDLQNLSPMPEPRLFEAVQRPDSADSSRFSSEWASGFQTSLASFR